MSDQRPVLQALLLADPVYRDGETRKHIIAVTFTQLPDRELPAGSRPRYRRSAP